MNEPVTKLMLVVGDFLINNKIEDATVVWMDIGKNAGSVTVIIKEYRKEKQVENNNYRRTKENV